MAIVNACGVDDSDDEHGDVRTNDVMLLDTIMLMR